MLLRLNQKVRGQVRVLLRHPAQMLSHRRRDATQPRALHRWNVVSLTSSLPRMPRGTRESLSQDRPTGRQVEEEGESECRLLTGRIEGASATDNIRAGSLLLHSLLSDTGGNDEMAIAGYYQGLGSVQAHGMYSDTRAYVNNVMALQQRFGGG